MGDLTFDQNSGQWVIDGTASNLPASLSAITGQPTWLPDLYYNLQNQASPNQVFLANQAANQGIVAAETNPITGQIVPAAQAYANQTAGAPGAAEASTFTQSTGSPFADAFDNLSSQITGSGTTVQSPGFPWGTVALIGAVIVGGIVLWNWKVA